MIWGQERESDTAIEILCDYCREHYHCEPTQFGNELLVPNGLSIPAEIPPLDHKQQYSSDEEFIGKHNKTAIEAMIADMTAPKHRFIRDLTYAPAIEYANNWALRYQRKSLAPMISSLCQILAQYDALVVSREKKRPRIETYRKQVIERAHAVKIVVDQCFRPSFKYDAEQDRLDHEFARKEQEEYRDAHMYDPFDARVSYHDSCRVDSTGHYWDSFHILECVDPQHLILDKPQYGSASITIVKRYKCKCIICGKEIIADSSGFTILYDDDKGFYPALKCDCHNVSSFEAKVMDILNNLGISYAREVSFAELVGDFGHPLRFDFALFSPNLRIAEHSNDIRLLLELQGPHHYKPGEYDEYGNYIEDKECTSLSAKVRLEKQMHYDNLKQQYCVEHGIILEVIKYTGISYEKLEDLITGIVSKYGFCAQSDDNLPF